MQWIGELTLLVLAAIAGLVAWRINQEAPVDPEVEEYDDLIYRQLWNRQCQS